MLRQGQQQQQTTKMSHVHHHQLDDLGPQHSSAYSSLANSTTEINEEKTVGGAGGASATGTLDSCGSSVNSASSTGGGGGNGGSNSNNGRSAEQIRNITQDYNTLLKRATDEIKTLAKEKYELEVKHCMLAQGQSP